ncbi:MAG: EAL domain-containing protein [Xanthomonadaceae bacterium]|nr:EAL domain-containing protein [Xanthomonadaceae bacterium]
MLKQDDTQQAAELRLAFIRHLPKRLETLRKRGLRLCTQGWDINALSILFRELQTLAGACGRYGLLDVGERLFAMESFLAPFVENVAIPDRAQTEAFTMQLTGLDVLIAQHEERHIEPAVTQAAQLTVAPARAGSYPLQVTPPPEYWKRFGPAPERAANAPAATLPRPAAAPAAAAAQKSSPAPTAAAITAIPPAAAPPPEAAVAAPASEQRKVFHLSDGNPLACEIDQKIEAAGYELTLLDRVDELKEVLAAFAPHLVVVDAPFQDALEPVGDMVKAARTRLGRRLGLLAFSDSGELPVRLRAMRAGADSFIPLPVQSGDVMARIAELLDADTADPFRVLIVEDDRSQAMFAESILRKAGMRTLAATDPLAALDHLDAFKPELILMDLYMPNCSGMELTAIIREREAFINTPIVFLSGEHDEEKHFEALNAGGDDFLSKPIRPKHLISAVTNRVRRARTLGRRAQANNPRDPVTGLYQRAHIVDRLNAMLAGDETDGGLVYIELDGAGRIRERVGLTSFDALFNQIGAFLAAHIGANDLAARYGDTSFVQLCQGDADALARLATDLRDRTAREVFEHEGKSLAVSLSFGICAFDAGLGDAGAMLNAAERALVEARTRENSHIGVYRTAATAVAGGEPLVEMIRAAIKAEDFQLLFQPMVALQSGDDEQFQALLRLRGDNGKLHTAAEILPVAERAGLAADIDRWVVSRCLLVIAERARQRRPVTLFAGQSIEAARDAQRAAWIGQMLETRRLPGERLVLEFRLPEVIAHVREATAFTSALRALNVGVSLAAFDANPASLQLLQHLPANYLKLDQRYSGSALRDPALREELRQIVTRAHDGGRRVIAPLIEDAQTASLLWTTGVDYLQGDFIQQAGQDMSFDFHAATA